jgi:hypothetical protein
MCKEYWLGILEGKDCWEDKSIDEKITIKCI